MFYTLITWHTPAIHLFGTKLNKMVAQTFPYTFQSLEISCSFLVAEPHVTFHCKKTAIKCVKSQLFLYVSYFDHVTHPFNTFVWHQTQQNGCPGILLHIPIIRISLWLSESRAARNQWPQENCNNCNNCNKKSLKYIKFRICIILWSRDTRHRHLYLKRNSTKCLPRLSPIHSNH